jgi:hypothetical protein
MEGRQTYLGGTSRVGSVSVSVIGMASGMGIMTEVSGRYVLLLVIGTWILISMAMAIDLAASERGVARHRLVAWIWEALIDLLVRERGRTGWAPSSAFPRGPSER